MASPMSAGAWSRNHPPCRPFSCLRLPPQNRRHWCGANRQNTRTLFFDRRQLSMIARASSLTHHPYLQTCRSRRTWPHARGACRASGWWAGGASGAGAGAASCARSAAGASCCVSVATGAAAGATTAAGRAAAAAVSPGSRLSNPSLEGLSSTLSSSSSVRSMAGPFLSQYRPCGRIAGSRGRSARWLVSYIPLGRNNVLRTETVATSDPILR